MSATESGPIVAGLGEAACAARLWRGPRTRHLTVVVKVLVELVPGGVARVIPGASIATRERHYRQLPSRSLEEASDLAPYLPRCDVTLRGHAHAPPGQPVPAMAVRLAVFGDQPLVDKRLHVFGDRDAGGAPQPFERMPLDWEHAFGGRSQLDNPVGRGADPSGAGATSPNVVDPADPRRPSGFAPISRYWGPRARALGSASASAFEAREPTFTEDFDWRYFQVAPADQQVPWLAGHEWIVLDGVHPVVPRVQSQLPGVRGVALVHAPVAGGWARPRPVDLHADTLAIDADRMVAAIAWRGSIVLDAAQDPSLLRVVGAVQAPGAPVAWPDPATLVGAPGAAAPAAAPDVRTRMLSPDEEAAASRAAAAPFVRGVALPPPSRGPTPAAPHTGTVAVAPDEPPPTTAPAPTTAPVPLGTVNLSPDDDFQASHLPSTPFREVGTSEEALARARALAGAAPQEAQGAHLGRTVGLSFGEAHLAAQRAVTPFPSGQVTRSPASARARATLDGADVPIPDAAPVVARGVRARRRVPRRESPQVPVVNVTPLAVATAPWQVRPPQDSLTVIVKGTFDLVPDAPAVLRDEVDPPTGDEHHDDDPARSLRHASDFALVKPRADVVLLGHAHAPTGPAPVVRVSFKLGDGKAPRGFERSIAVLGDRTWKPSGGSAIPGPPTPFERIPIVYERAFGGEAHPPNPVGVGRRGDGGGARLPNLEDPRHPLMSPSDSPPPACFGPVAPLWPARLGRLGTYDAAWLAARWPYFPADFDWAYFQSAPPAQQVDHLRGDEPFEVSGMHAEHARLRGTLPRLRVRAFALETEEAGGELFEITLHLDTATFDVDAMKLDLVWRGLVEVSDDEAPELETLFVHTEDLTTPPLPLEVIRQLLLDAAAPEDEPEEDPGPMVTPPPTPPRPDPALREAALARLSAGESFAGADLQGVDLTGVDLARRDLAGANLKEAALRGSRLAGADLREAMLAGADLRGCDLAGADLTRADLTGAHLDDASLEGAVLDGADLTGVRAERASFRRARGEAVQLVGASLADARFDGAELPSLDLSDALLDRASFEDATLPEIRLHHARGEAARFDRARLVEGRCDDAYLPRGSFVGLRAPASTWEKAHLAGATFAGAHLAEASFTRAACDKASFARVDAPEARFARARLPGASLEGANLREADLERADLSGADLRRASLHAAETWKAKLTGARLDEAIVTGSKLAPRA